MNLREIRAEQERQKTILVEQIAHGPLPETPPPDPALVRAAADAVAAEIARSRR